MATIFENDHNVQERAMSLAKGSYQKGLLSGQYDWSGADLCGEARRYGWHYSLSRTNLIKRLREASLYFVFWHVGQHGYKIAVVKDEESKVDTIDLIHAEGYRLQYEGPDPAVKERNRVRKNERARLARAARSPIQKRADSLRRRLAKGVPPDPDIILGDVEEILLPLP